MGIPRKQVSQSICVTDPTEVAEQLEKMDLTVDELQTAVARGFEHRIACPSHLPTYYLGPAQTAYVVAALRSLKLPDWSKCEHKNFSRTIHPSGKFAIVASSGCDKTGVAGYLPTTKSPKGFCARQAVSQNRTKQMSLLKGHLELLPGGQLFDHAEPVDETWFLLFYVSELEIRAELSLPIKVNPDNNHVDDWSRRIIIPSVMRSSIHSLGAPDFAAEPDITIRRKSE